ncbi:hypothetical protein V5799_002883 [Amblyomma americanum]|uniref:Secreted protein n=1 Tax=Amblyomma americanum TaxID=6943 RepID=A0AAQ4DAJ5_AMBAM
MKGTVATLCVISALIGLSEFQPLPTTTRKPFCPRWCPLGAHPGHRCAPMCTCVRRPPSGSVQLPCVWSPAQAVPRYHPKQRPAKIVVFHPRQ